ncbi:MAG: hypothetical protein AB2L14_10195 [Candidatus Xenobiia bacterium LiM19]
METDLIFIRIEELRNQIREDLGHLASTYNDIPDHRKNIQLLIKKKLGELLELDNSILEGLPLYELSYWRQTWLDPNTIGISIGIPEKSLKIRYCKPGKEVDKVDQYIYGVILQLLAFLGCFGLGIFVGIGWEKHQQLKRGQNPEQEIQKPQNYYLVLALLANQIEPSRDKVFANPKLSSESFDILFSSAKWLYYAHKAQNSIVDNLLAMAAADQQSKLDFIYIFFDLPKSYDGFKKGGSLIDKRSALKELLKTEPECKITKRLASTTLYDVFEPFE